MKFTYLIFVAMFFLIGCEKETPKCADEKTMNLIKQIFIDDILKNNVTKDEGNKLYERDVSDVMVFKFTRPSSFDPSISKYSCISKLTVANKYSISIDYVSQLDDVGQHIVSISGISSEIIYEISRVILEEKRGLIIEAKDLRNNNKNQRRVTVFVHDVSNYSESGDGYGLMSKSGKWFYVYTAGGSQPRMGEKFIKKNAVICLTLDPEDGMGDVSEVSQGECN